MQTKAELEAEISRLRERVAELEGAVAAYQYALSQINKPEPLPYYPATDQWRWTFPNVTTSPTFPGTFTYNLDTTE